MLELPVAFENRMKALLGTEYTDFLTVLQTEDAVKGLRVNPCKISPDVFAKNAPFPLREIAYVPGGYIVSEEAQAGKHPYHHAGAYYMQDPGAMASIAAIPTDFWERKGLKILDLCAAPGGKTTQLAALCAPMGGMVMANEYHPARSRILAGNIERLGIANTCVTNLDSRYPAQWYPAFFDLVVVDAPCSGEGMYRKNDLAISEWSPENVLACAARQKEILRNAAKCVASGGYLLYSTCTYATEENEEVVAAFLSENPDFRLQACAPAVVEHTADGIDVTGGKCADLALCRRFYPHISAGEGQFVALLCREEGDISEKKTGKDAFSEPSRADRRVAEDFLTDTLGRLLPGICVCGGNLSLFPAHDELGFAIPPFGVIAQGVTLGELRKNRLVPHHHFFMAFGAEMHHALQLSPNDPAVAAYLAGEEIAVADGQSGFTSVLVRLGDTALSLGGGKAVDGRLKNYYPKGLRVR